MLEHSLLTNNNFLIIDQRDWIQAKLKIGGCFSLLVLQPTNISVRWGEVISLSIGLLGQLLEHTFAVKWTIGDQCFLGSCFGRQTLSVGSEQITTFAYKSVYICCILFETVQNVYVLLNSCIQYAQYMLNIIFSQKICLEVGNEIHIEFQPVYWFSSVFDSSSIPAPIDRTQ